MIMRMLIVCVWWLSYNVNHYHHYNHYYHYMVLLPIIILMCYDDDYMCRAPPRKIEQCVSRMWKQWCVPFDFTENPCLLFYKYICIHKALILVVIMTSLSVILMIMCVLIVVFMITMTAQKQIFSLSSEE